MSARIVVALHGDPRGTQAVIWCSGWREALRAGRALRELAWGDSVRIVMWASEYSREGIRTGRMRGAKQRDRWALEVRSARRWL